MTFTRRQLEQLRQEGKIRGFLEKLPKTNECKKKSADSVLEKLPKRSKEKDWMEKNLWAWCLGKKIDYVPEHRFHPERKWRFDWCIPSLTIAIEYEGLMSKKSRHTTISGFTGDSEKYNAAQALGWKVLRYTALNYKELIYDLNKIANGK
jgi:hypothetical protein